MAKTGNEIIINDETLKLLKEIERVRDENPKAFAEILLKEGVTSKEIEQFCRETGTELKDNPVLEELRRLEKQ